jgi:hypothetical protein
MGIRYELREYEVDRRTLSLKRLLPRSARHLGNSSRHWSPRVIGLHYIAFSIDPG